MSYSYGYHFAADGDYIVYGHYCGEDGWVEHTRWLIPGTQLED